MSGHTIETLPNLYENIPAYEDPIAKKFMVKIEEPQWRLARMAGVTGNVICQVLIGENAQVEAIYINQSVSPILDNSVVEAVKSSKFKTLMEVMGRKGKYSILIPWNFWIQRVPFARD